MLSLSHAIAVATDSTIFHQIAPLLVGKRSCIACNARRRTMMSGSMNQEAETQDKLIEFRGRRPTATFYLIVAISSELRKRNNIDNDGDDCGGDSMHTIKEATQNVARIFTLSWTFTLSLAPDRCVRCLHVSQIMFAALLIFAIRQGRTQGPSDAKSCIGKMGIKEKKIQRERGGGELSLAQAAALST